MWFLALQKRMNPLRKLPGAHHYWRVLMTCHSKQQQPNLYGGAYLMTRIQSKQGCSHVRKVGSAAASAAAAAAAGVGGSVGRIGDTDPRCPTVHELLRIQSSAYFLRKLIPVVSRRRSSSSSSSSRNRAYFILLHPATPHGDDQAVMPTPRGRRLPPSHQGGGA
jgi:hypothetical protein